MNVIAAQSEGAGRKPRLAVTMGDPLGIGPEVTVKALADPALRRRGRFVIFGMSGVMHEAARRAGIEPYWWQVRAGSPAIADAGTCGVVLIDNSGSDRDHASDEAHPERGRATAAGGVASFQFVEDAIEAAKAANSHPLAVQGIVTAPISKAAWAMAGKGKYPGHTDLLQTRFGAKRVRMMFVAPKLRVILATAHVPLMEIRNSLTIGRVFDTIDLGWQACKGLGVARPRIRVCGLNPHAGEDGLLGDEETRIIEPGVRLARERGMDVVGPLPGDTIWRDAQGPRCDLVVAMYHDQGLIPVKLTAFDSAVNTTVGLPTVRTSPDHGTAYDIAGTNQADSGSMRAAVDLALKMVGSRASERVT